MCYRKSVSSSSEISRCSFSYYVPVTTASRLPFVGAATSVSTLYSFKECHSPADWRRGHRDHYRYVFVQVRFQWSLESSNGHLSAVSHAKYAKWVGEVGEVLPSRAFLVPWTHPQLTPKSVDFRSLHSKCVSLGVRSFGVILSERLICPFLPQNIFQWAD